MKHVKLSRTVYRTLNTKLSPTKEGADCPAKPRLLRTSHPSTTFLPILGGIVCLLIILLFMLPIISDRIQRGMHFSVTYASREAGECNAMASTSVIDHVPQARLTKSTESNNWFIHYSWARVCIV